MSYIFKDIEIHGILASKIKNAATVQQFERDTFERLIPLVFSKTYLHAISIHCSLQRGTTTPKTSSRFISFILRSFTRGGLGSKRNRYISIVPLYDGGRKFPGKSKNSDKPRIETPCFQGFWTRFISVYSHLTGRFPEQRIWISSLVAGNSREYFLETVNVRANGHGGKHREFVLERESSSFLMKVRLLLGRYPWDYISYTKRYAK